MIIPLSTMTSQNKIGCDSGGLCMGEISSINNFTTTTAKVCKL